LSPAVNQMDVALGLDASKAVGQPSHNQGRDNLNNDFASEEKRPKQNQNENNLEPIKQEIEHSKKAQEKPKEKPSRDKKMPKKAEGLSEVEKPSVRPSVNSSYGRTIAIFVVTPTAIALAYFLIQWLKSKRREPILPLRMKNN